MADEDKREKIISAAYEVLSVKGYDKASTKEIAKSAGVAQGLINYYFPSKDLLFAEVFRRETERYCLSFGDLKAYANRPISVGLIREILESPQRRGAEGPDWFRLQYELAAIGLRNDSALPTLRETLNVKRGTISDIIESIVTLPDGQARSLSAILYGVFEGLGMQKAADPDFAYEEAFDLLAAMLGAYYEALNARGELPGGGRNSEPGAEKPE